MAASQEKISVPKCENHTLCLAYKKKKKRCSCIHFDSFSMLACATALAPRCVGSRETRECEWELYRCARPMHIQLLRTALVPRRNNNMLALLLCGEARRMRTLRSKFLQSARGRGSLNWICGCTVHFKSCVILFRQRDKLSTSYFSLWQKFSPPKSANYTWNPSITKALKRPNPHGSCNSMHLISMNKKF